MIVVIRIVFSCRFNFLIKDIESLNILYMFIYENFIIKFILKLDFIFDYIFYLILNEFWLFDLRI